VQGLHEGQHGYLQHLLQAQGRELERSRAKHALGLDPGVDTGSREENASKQEARASVLILSEPITLQGVDKKPCEIEQIRTAAL
jgi:hypothetical protein